jgi:hypothetical protein
VSQTTEAAVDFRKLGNALAALGAIVVAGALVWWFVFYSSVVDQLGRAPGGKETGAGVRDMWRCLYSSDGLCALISGGANLIGKTPYEPRLFWAGLGALVVGVIIRIAAKPRAAQ